MAFIAAGSVRLYYHIEGDGPSVVFLHGYACSSADWRETVRRLRSACRSIVLDFRNHGQSDSNTPHVAFEDLLADLTALLSSGLFETPAVLVGHSMGGMLATEYALRHPERTSALILVDAATHLQTARTLLPPGMCADGTPPAIKARIEATMTAGKRRMDDALIQSLLAWSAVDRVGALIVPTLCLIGDRYGKLTDHDLTAIRQGYGYGGRANVELKLIRDAAHFIQLEQPEALSAQVKQFIAGRKGQEEHA